MFSAFRARLCHYFNQYSHCNTQSSTFLHMPYKKYNCNFNTKAEIIDIKPNENKPVSEIFEDESENFGSLKNNLEIPKSVRAFRRDKYSKKSFISKSKKPNTFGTLSDNKIMWYPEMKEEPQEDNDPSDDGVIVRNLSKRYRCPQKYFDEMKRLVEEKKLKEALDLFVDMKKNYVTPIHGHYTFMISACGKVGYTDMAFQLFRQMTDRGYRPTPATLTGLFNSCAESPFPVNSLKRAVNLKEKIKSKNWSLTQITYHSMIKAFAKCGDIQLAFQVVDEMAKEKVKIDVTTYSFLLMSCISNREAGFTHAVEVWRKMKARKCIPNLFTCNLILRAVRDCDAGPEEISSLLLQHWSSYSQRPYGFETKKKIKSKENPLLLKSAEKSYIKENLASTPSSIKHSMKGNNLNNSTDKLHEICLSSSSKEEILITNNSKEVSTRDIFQQSTVSLLDTRPLNGPQILELVNISSRSDRLALIGGMEGFLKFMAEVNVKPDIITFTLLLDNLPSNSKAEENLLIQLDAHKVLPDIDFFNMLIKRRNFRNDSAAAHKVLLMINKYGLLPDIVTFGVLALGCKSYRLACIFINDMEKFGFTPNIEIIDALLRNAGKEMDFVYIKAVLEFMKVQEIQPDERFLKRIEKLLGITRKNIISMEHGQKVSNIYYKQDFGKKFKLFCSFYEEWLKNMNVDMEQHPWSQFHTNIIHRTKDELNHNYLAEN